MRYISTRGKAPKLGFEQAMLQGLAEDGGLYVPENIPIFSSEKIASFATMDYKQLAFEIMKPFVEEDINDQELTLLIDKSYANFSHKDIAPLKRLEDKLWVLELFHGPTLAFKDFALQFLGNLLDHVLKKKAQKVVIMGATSGDTGSAAIEGCRHSDNVNIFILHPHKKVSAVQRKQMTTVKANNVFNLAIEGNFDDCQNIIKESFADQNFLPDDRQLVAINSINWARIMAQIVYYFYAAVTLGAPEKSVSFSVPTGNFGDIFAGYLAKKMGLPIEQLIVATNANDILHRCISNNDLSVKQLQHSLSPSMDIMVSSNFERLLFDLYQRDTESIVTLMGLVKEGMPAKLEKSALWRLRSQFSSACISDDETVSMISQEYDATGYLLDPHTAIGVAAARKARNNDSTPVVCLATAHPAKFPDAVQASTYVKQVALPGNMSDLMAKPEFYDVLANDINQVHQHLMQKLAQKMS